MSRRKITLIIAIVLLVMGSVAVYAQQQRCGPCSGRGVITHSACRGTGKSSTGVHHPNGTFTANNCVGCGGSGVISCPTCRGSGVVKR
ncbi:MAG: hypothetical protein LBH16_03795 [Treponema sp.]|nr:hypothetical protein [Treponema sp.]